MGEQVNRLARLIITHRNICLAATNTSFRDLNMMSKPDSPNVSATPAVSSGTGSSPGGTRRPRVDKRAEALILEIAFQHPGYGQDRVARMLKERNIHVSASGVRYVWQRHNLETIGRRVARIEVQLGANGSVWTEEQCIARDRVQADSQVRSMAASIVGQTTGDVSRSAYILAVASHVMRERGYDATHLRDIAKRAQIPMGSMYYHFQTKEELFAAVYEEEINRLIAGVNAAIARFDDPWDRLEIACATHLQNLCGSKDVPSYASPTNLPRIYGPARTRLILLNDRYEEMFKLLIAALDLPADLPSNLIRLQLLGALNWTGVWYKPGKSTPEEIAKSMVGVIRFGLERPPKDLSGR